MNDFINMGGTNNEDQVTPQYGGQTLRRQQQCHSLLTKENSWKPHIKFHCTDITCKLETKLLGVHMKQEGHIKYLSLQSSLNY